MSKPQENLKQLIENHPLFKRYADACGRCIQCYEHCPVLSPCCLNAPVELEGETVSVEGIASEIADDIGADPGEVDEEIANIVF